jgi:hypothetical protein
VLIHRFPSMASWGQDGSQAGGGVITAVSVGGNTQE